MEAQFVGMKLQIGYLRSREDSERVRAAAGPGRLKVELPTCSVFGRSRGLLPIFQPMVGTSFRTLIADLVAFILPINNFVE